MTTSAPQPRLLGLHPLWIVVLGAFAAAHPCAVFAQQCSLALPLVGSQIVKTVEAREPGRCTVELVRDLALRSGADVLPTGRADERFQLLGLSPNGLLLWADVSTKTLHWADLSDPVSREPGSVALPLMNEYAMRPGGVKCPWRTPNTALITSSALREPIGDSVFAIDTALSSITVSPKPALSEGRYADGVRQGARYGGSVVGVDVYYSRHVLYLADPHGLRSLVRRQYSSDAIERTILDVALDGEKIVCLVARGRSGIGGHRLGLLITDLEGGSTTEILLLVDDYPEWGSLSVKDGMAYLTYQRSVVMICLVSYESWGAEVSDLGVPSLISHSENGATLVLRAGDVARWAKISQGTPAPLPPVR